MVDKQEKIMFEQGNIACAEGALAAGARLFAGYPITPSSEIAEWVARRLPSLDGIYLQMEDELASIAAIIGGSLSGLKTFTATSGPGFSLMQENLGVAIIAEVPCVIINVQRAGPSTGLATKPAQGDIMQARWGTHGDHAIITLAPSSVQECFDLTIQAFNLAEKYRTPVILLSDEIVGHLREKFIVKSPSGLFNRVRPECEVKDYKPYAAVPDGVPPMAAFGSKYLFHASSSMHDETGFSNNTPDNAAKFTHRLSAKIYNNRKDIISTDRYMTEGADYLIIAYGITYRSAMAAAQAARKQGLKVGVLKLTTIWPFPDDEIRMVAQAAQKVIVPEMNLGQIKNEVQRLVPTDKLIGLSKVNGQIIWPEEILNTIKKVDENEKSRL